MPKVVSITFELLDEDARRSYVERRSFMAPRFLDMSNSAIYPEVQAMIYAIVREINNPARPIEGSNN